MRKTTFAGLTVLDTSESLLQDGGAFIGRDRDTIDRLLQIGAKTHRHTGLPGLGNPATAMGASAVGSAGTIAGGLSLSVGYTIEDSNGGETMLSPVILVATPDPLDPPDAAPTAVAEYGSGGDLPVDAYYYVYSLVDADGGETPPGPHAFVEREIGYANARIVITDLNDELIGGAVAWRLYRAIGGGDFHYLASGASGGYIDDGSDSVNCDIGPLNDDVNTSLGTNSLVIALPNVADGETINVYVSDGGDFVGNVFLDAFPIGSAGQHVIYRTLTLDSGQPPDTNQSIGGASMIDPDSELLDWHWKRPVQTVAALPSGEQGDIRLVYDASAFAYLPEDGSVPGDWELIDFSGGVGGGGGGMGASALIDVTDDNGPTYNDRSELQFHGSGVASVVVTDEGAGVSRITVFTPAGGSALTVTDGSNPITDVSELFMYGGPGTSVINVLGGPGGLAEFRFDNALALRSSHNFVSASIAASGVGAEDYGNGNLFPSYRVLAVETDIPARVRVYGTDADRDADSARAIGVDPTGDHGVLLDVVTTPDDLARRLSPQVDVSNLDSPVDDVLYFNITNLTGAADTVSVTLLMKPTEALPLP